MTVLPSGGSLALPLPSRSATLAVTTLDFEDVPVTHPFCDFVMTVADDGVSAGCGGSLFCPESSVTRGHMAVFLLKAKLGANHRPPAASGSVFGGVHAGDAFEDLYGRGITGGCSENPSLDCPNTANTRRQMAAFLKKTFDLP
jgi:S-layer homology domain